MKSTPHGNESGSIAIQFALTVFALTVAAGGTVDYARATKAKQELQTVVDALALKAAASAEAERGEITPTIAALQSDASGNKIHASIDGHEITVFGERRITPSFLGLIGMETMRVSARAVAYRAPVPPRKVAGLTPVCVLALAEEAEYAVDFGGNTTFNAPDCVVHANSRHKTRALGLRGSAEAHARMFCARGGISGVPRGANCEDEVPDPYLDRISPAAVQPNDCATVTEVGPGETATLRPGTYCRTLHLQGTVTLLPGEYVLTRGLHINSQANVTGEGVTLRFVDPLTPLAGREEPPFTINGGGRLHLEAPEDGMLIVQTPGVYDGRELVVNGNSATRLVGAVYTPTMNVRVNGTGEFGQLSRHTPLVANTVRFTGTSRIGTELDAFPHGLAPASIVDAVDGAGEESVGEDVVVVRLVR